MKNFLLCSLAFVAPQWLQAAADEPDVIYPEVMTISQAYIGLPSPSLYPFEFYNNMPNDLVIDSIRGLEGSDFSFQQSVPDALVLKPAMQLSAPLIYNPTYTGATEVTMTVYTSIGNYSVILQGKKSIAPEGARFESFEGDYFPPAGWVSQEMELSNAVVASGQSALANQVWGVERAYLQSPRLDLSSGQETLTFDFCELFTGEDLEPLLSNYQTVEIKSGNNDYVEIWSSDEVLLNADWSRITLDLSEFKSDACYIQFVYHSLSGEIGASISNAFWDNIVLPPLYGDDMPPAASAHPLPDNNAKGILYGEVALSWDPVLFAQSYQLFVGTSPDNLTPVATLADTQFTLTDALPSTNYYWQVKPINTYGQTSQAPIWVFSTQADGLVTQFPYRVDFEKDSPFPANGWRVDGEGVMWKMTDIYPYNGTGSAFCRRMANKDDGKSAMLISPIVSLPEGPSHISFAWCNNSPGGASYFDPEDVTLREEPNDTLYCELQEVGQTDWTVLAHNVSPYEEGNEWSEIAIDLSSYAGKEVQIRWRYVAINSYKSCAATLDDVEINVGVPQSIDHATAETITANPTRTTGLIHLSRHTDVVLYNHLGVVVLAAQHVDVLHIDHLPSGIYLLLPADQQQPIKIQKID